MIEKGGTTIWESWKGGLASYNHPMFGSVSEWFYKSLGGICPEDDAIGFDRFIIKPGLVGDLEWVKASYHSLRGNIQSNWKIQDDQLHLDLEIPVNTSANIYIPSGSPEQIREGGLGLDAVEGIVVNGNDGQYTRIEVGSGTYHFVSALK